MSESPPAAYRFLPWVRSGAAATVTSPASVTASLPARAVASVTLRVAGARPGGQVVSEDLRVPLVLYGPGDVIGLDPRNVVRTVPRHQAPDFPPHRFAAVELDRPDLPWLFTPAGADAQGRLRPWLVLVVVRQEVSRLTFDPRRPLPVLDCPLAELPDLEDSWAWAHVQFAGTLQEGETVEGAMARRPQQAVSRLLCPRRLVGRLGGAAPGYYACLVPAFASGRRAGLGERFLPEEEAAPLTPAWPAPPAGGRVLLPVYYHWEFNTGAEGDFESLVDRLRLPEDEATSPSRRMDLSQAGGGLPAYPGATLDVVSALRPFRAPPPPWPATLPGDFRTRLTAILEAPDRPVGVPPLVPPPPAAAPPIYGRGHAGAGAAGPTPLSSPGTAGPPLWLRDLNLDPRYRVAAALGTQVVQREQEQLVTSAWEQAGAVQRVNQWLRQKQLAREVAVTVHQNRLQRLTEGALRQITAPAAEALSLLPAEDGTLAAAGAAASRQGADRAAIPAAPAREAALLDALVSAPFRRVARPLSALARQAGAAQAPSPAAAGARGGAPGSSGAWAVGAAAFGDLPRRVLDGEIALGAGDAGSPPGAAPDRGPRAAAGPPAPETAAQLLQRLEPRANFAAEAQSRLELPPDQAGVWDRSDVLAPVLMVPGFPRPMYEPLRELFQDHLLPGLEAIPPNSLTLLVADARFVEAYMVGLNHELSRELLWREFPADLQGTYFRHFWDTRGGATSAPGAGNAPDIPPIAAWQQGLGANGTGGGDRLILLIRGDLLQRFPNVLVYAKPGKWSKDAANQSVAPAVVDDDLPPELPDFRLTLGGDVTLVAFPPRLTRDLVAGDPAPGGSLPAGRPGYFFVLQEHPTEPGFGLDVAPDPAGVPSWRELAWQHVPQRTDGSGHITLRTTGPAPPAGEEARWGQNSAHMAAITLRRPYELRIHAANWLPPDA
jgi:hypothetical protein